jgi:3-methyladenine DNA glycosylase Mpg
LEFGFCHVYTIHGLGCCACFVCQFANWSEAADLGIN